MSHRFIAILTLITCDKWDFGKHYQTGSKVEAWLWVCFEVRYVLTSSTYHGLDYEVCLTMRCEMEKKKKTKNSNSNRWISFTTDKNRKPIKTTIQVQDRRGHVLPDTLTLTIDDAAKLRHRALAWSWRLPPVDLIGQSKNDDASERGWLEGWCR